jgi:GxxExxY protein
MDHDEASRPFWDLTRVVIGACIEVHRHMGPGLLESTYEECLAHELATNRIQFERQRPLPLHYKGIDLDTAYFIDLLVEDRLIVELKACERLLAVHEAQLLTYMKLSKRDVGLLVNFNVPILKDGVRRLRLKPAAQ